MQVRLSAAVALFVLTATVTLVSVQLSLAGDDPARPPGRRFTVDYYSMVSPDRLAPYPSVEKGERTPFDLWNYGGRAGSSFGNPDLPMPWNEWLAFHREQKPALMRDVNAYMASRYDFSGKAIPGAFMSGGRKPVMAGPVARLPEDIESYEALAALGPDAIRERNLFPYKPLAHPLQSVAHMVFPASWIKVHPEHGRIDVDLDIPDAYLHDGRLPTLHDTVEFFNLVLELGLTRQEKEDLVAYLLCL